MNGSAVNGGGGAPGVERELVDEKVTFIADSSHADRFLPRISVSKEKSGPNARHSSVEKSFRPFTSDDMPRVLDFDELPAPPKDATMRFCEDGGTEGLKFPVRHVCVRGGFLFYFDIEDVDDHDGGGRFVSYLAPPLGVVPLADCDIALPPGGRRVFREHAHTDARNGYELVLIHDPDDRQGGEVARPAAFLVAQSLVEREKWVQALKSRAEFAADTKLRRKSGRQDVDGSSSMGVGRGGFKSSGGKAQKMRGARNLQAAAEAAENEEEQEIEQACKEFGVSGFEDEGWIDRYFATNNDLQATAKIDELEQWQVSIKKGVRGAVLEQYAYFVEASSEMTTMGKEVSSLKSMVETQNEVIKEMKDIDFGTAFADGELDSLASDDEIEPGALRRKTRRRRALQSNVPDDDQSDASSLSSSADVRSKRKGGEDEEGVPGSMEIPGWLDDVHEEISAFIKECRYSDATNLLFKAKTEIVEILALHERPTEVTLSKKQHANMNNILNSMDTLSERMCNRLVESLRRKNEALKQAGKRERADPSSIMAPMVSPCCLHDDLIPLQLLVRLGKTQEAATAYAARRSLLLLESLHERPISGTGNVDLVIYAAQLSQSFFSCLAGSVEGFLDLFQFQSELGSPSHDDHSVGNSSSSMMTAASRNVPPGALSSIVLWCDSELSKFSSAFGGTRILGNLALSPPPRSESQKAQSGKMRMVGAGFDEETQTSSSSKERQNAIEVAAQCVNQAFQYASENLDNIGLPLTPRLAEYIRSRLKGCEAEVARLLDGQWRHAALDWEADADPHHNDDHHHQLEDRNARRAPHGALTPPR
mmetsp:Transcript_54111/g.80741  ORF Transcript_54111/g.80741 Transcript_54111/m.80741 type:complete len:821 (-) Transcript_54111:68-2530(-)